MTEATNRPDREYGARALMGVAAPQANPIVEPEFNALMPHGVSVIATPIASAGTVDK